jgi:hypothetical protein
MSSLLLRSPNVELLFQNEDNLIPETPLSEQSDHQSLKFLPTDSQPVKIYEKVIQTGSATRQNLLRKGRACSEGIFTSYPRLRICCGSWGRSVRCICILYVVLHICIALSYNFERSGWILYFALFCLVSRFSWWFLPWIWHRTTNLLPEPYKGWILASANCVFVTLFCILVFFKSLHDNTVISFLGLVLGILLCYIFSYNRGGISWRPVVNGMLLQVWQSLRLYCNMPSLTTCLSFVNPHSMSSPTLFCKPLSVFPFFHPSAMPPRTSSGTLKVSLAHKT